MNTAQQFALLKLAEECSELITELTKLASFPDGNYPSRKYRERPLMRHVEDEMGYVKAALVYFQRHFPDVNLSNISDRMLQKLAVYDIYVQELKDGVRNEHG
jgi:hypothetical protein